MSVDALAHREANELEATQERMQALELRVLELMDKLEERSKRCSELAAKVAELEGARDGWAAILKELHREMRRIRA